MINLTNILPPPVLPHHLDESAQWLAGEGAGSWFLIKEVKENLYYEITRFSPEGIQECKGVFSSDRKLDLTHKYELTYPSHCHKITVVQNEEVINMKNVE